MLRAVTHFAFLSLSPSLSFSLSLLFPLSLFLSLSFSIRVSNPLVVVATTVLLDRAHSLILNRLRCDFRLQANPPVLLFLQQILSYLFYYFSPSGSYSRTFISTNTNEYARADPVRRDRRSRISLCLAKINKMAATRLHGCAHRFLYITLDC